MSHISSSQENSASVLKKYGRRLVFGFGMFAAAITTTEITGTERNNSVQMTLESPDYSKDNISARPVKETDFRFSLSLDCSLSFGGAKQLDKLGLSREAYMPLNMGIKQGGGMSDIFWIGQRSPGKKEGAPVTDGWGLIYNDATKEYYIYNVHTEDRIPDGVDPSSPDAVPVPHVVTTPLSLFSIDNLNERLHKEFSNDAMVLNIDYQQGNPYGPLHFSLSCFASGS